MLFRLQSNIVVPAVAIAVLSFGLVTGAQAEEVQNAPGFWALLFTKGGLVTWVIALSSAVGLPIAAVKIYQYVQMDIWRPQELSAAMQNYKNGQVQGLSARFEELAHPAASLLGYAIGEAHGGSLAPALLREELARRAQYLIRHLARHIWILELIAASAPLLGLLGTVLGMIVAFQGVGQGSGGADTALLAAGIWEALLTTAFGLGVALPFSILAAILNNAVDDVRDFVEDALSDILVRAERAG